MECPKCSKKYDDSYDWCPHCGTIGNGTKASSKEDAHGPALSEPGNAGKGSSSRSQKVKKRCRFCFAPLRVPENVDPICPFCKKRLARGEPPTWQDRVRHERTVVLCVSAAVLVLWAVATLLIVLVPRKTTSDIQNLEASFLVLTSILALYYQ